MHSRCRAARRKLTKRRRRCWNHQSNSMDVGRLYEHRCRDNNVLHPQKLKTRLAAVEADADGSKRKLANSSADVSSLQRTIKELEHELQKASQGFCAVSTSLVWAVSSELASTFGQAMLELQELPAHVVLA